MKTRRTTTVYFIFLICPKRKLASRSHAFSIRDIATRAGEARSGRRREERAKAWPREAKRKSGRRATFIHLRVFVRMRGYLARFGSGRVIRASWSFGKRLSPRWSYTYSFLVSNISYYTRAHTHTHTHTQVTAHSYTHIHNYIHSNN